MKHLDAAQPPWLPDSEFSILQRDLQSWHANLPSSLEFTAESMYIRLEGAQLGALALLHCTYHNAMCDLYRISTPELFKLKDAVAFPPAQAGFAERMRARSLHHARSIVGVLADTARQGARFLTDSQMPCYAYNADRVMLYYVARLLDKTRPDAKEVIEETIGYVETNHRILQIMAVMNPLAEPLV